MKNRLDSELVRRGLARSRENAADLIESRSVLVNGIPATKSASQVDAETSIVIQGQRDDFVTHTTAGKTYKIGTGGDNVSYFACDTHEYSEGDHISSTKGNKYTMVKEGDYGVHVQDKNIDFQADSGKARIKTGSDILIESDTKITLKVGGSSIVITPSNITIK